MAAICFRLPRAASRRSIRRPAGARHDPGTRRRRDSGLAWAEGTLWVGQYRDRKIHQIDPETGAILRTIESNRFVTGVTWVDGELWHGTWEGDESELRRIDPRTGEVLERLEMPPDVAFRGSSPTAATGSSAEAERAEGSEAVRRPKRDREQVGAN
jgi:sugar lactone lactonase YvrE